MAPQEPNSRLEYTLGYSNDYDDQYPPLVENFKIVPIVTIWPLSPEELNKQVCRVCYCDEYNYGYNKHFPPIQSEIVVIWPKVPVWPVINSKYIKSIPVVASEISSTDENLDKYSENSSTNEDSDKDSQNSLSEDLDKDSEISSFEKDIVKDAENNLSEEQAVGKEQNFLPTSVRYNDQFPPIQSGIFVESLWPLVPVWPNITARYLKQIPVACVEIKLSEEDSA